MVHKSDQFIRIWVHRLLGFHCIMIAFSISEFCLDVNFFVSSILIWYHWIWWAKLKVQFYLIILMVMWLCWLWKIFDSLYICSIFGAPFVFLDEGGGRRGFEVFYFRSFWFWELNALNASVLLNVGLGLYLETKRTYMVKFMI